MPEIIPAIIAKDFAELERKIRLVEPYVTAVQIDVMDGIFAPQESWPYLSGGLPSISELTKIKTAVNLEAHLMVAESEREIDQWISSGVKRILVHIESTKKLREMIGKIKAAGVAAGVVLNLETDVSAVNDIIGQIDVVELMAIAQIGYHGQPLDERVIPRIHALQIKYPDVKIEVDGGVNLVNAGRLVEAGADILVAGSAIFGQADVGKAIGRLKESFGRGFSKKIS